MKPTLDEEYAKLIQDQIDLAARALEEASKLANAVGKDLLELEYEYDRDTDTEHEWIDLSGIMKGLDNGGWSTSSMKC